LKNQGKTATQHKQPLSSDYFNKLYISNAVSTCDPKGLQNEVFVDVMVHLCNRERDNLREIKKSDFQINRPCWCQYVSISDKLTKNHQGQNTYDHSQQGRMYELSGNPKCPVMSFEKYTAKLNGELDDFWQKPATRSVKEETIC